MVFSRQEYWSVLPFPPPGDLPDSGIKPMSLASPALANRFFTTESPGKPAFLIKLTNGVSAGPSTEHSGLLRFPELHDCRFCCSFAQLCLTLCNPMDCSTPGLPVPPLLDRWYIYSNRYNSLSSLISFLFFAMVGVAFFTWCCLPPNF